MGKIKQGALFTILAIAMPVAAAMAADYQPYIPPPPAAAAAVAPQPRIGFALFGPRRFWQGAYGIAGRTPVVTVRGSQVTYVGVDQRSYPVSNVLFAETALTFQVEDLQVSLTRLPDARVEMVSTRGANNSPAIELCENGTAACQ
jgi:hypothetical protein